MNRLQFLHICGHGEIKLRDPLLICGIFIKHPCSGQAVFGVETIVGIMGDDHIGGGPFLHENIIIEPIIAVENGHKAHDFRPVRHVVGGIAPIRSAANAG